MRTTSNKGSASPINSRFLRLARIFEGWILKDNPSNDNTYFHIIFQWWNGWIRKLGATSNLLSYRLESIQLKKFQDGASPTVSLTWSWLIDWVFLGDVCWNCEFICDWCDACIWPAVTTFEVIWFFGWTSIYVVIGFSAPCSTGLLLMLNSGSKVNELWKFILYILSIVWTEAILKVKCYLWLDLLVDLNGLKQEFKLNKFKLYESQ